LDKLNVVGELANTSNANTFKADISGLATAPALSAVSALVDELESRLTAIRAGYLDKLNVTGVLANTDNANTFKADVSGLATASALSAVSALVDDLESRLTAIRAGYLDKLNVTGTLANTDNANLFKADVSNLDATISSRLATTDYIAPDNDGITEIKAKTDNLPATPANEATLTAIKGAGWTDETLVALMTAIESISADSGATPQQIWEYATRTLTGLPALPTQWITPDGIRSDVIDEIQNGLATETTLEAIKGAGWTVETLVEIYYAIKNILIDNGAIADAVWDEKLSEHTLTDSVGGTITNIKNDTTFIESASQNILNKVNTTPIVINGRVSKDTISDIRGNDWTISVPVSLPEGKYQFAIKKHTELPDEDSIVFIHSLTGLEILNGKPYTNTSDGSIYYRDGNLTINISSNATSLILFGKYIYGIQAIGTDGKVIEKYSGIFYVEPDIVRTTK